MPGVLSIPHLNYLFLQAPDDYFGGFSWYDLAPNQGPGILRSRKLLDEVFNQLEKDGYAFQNIFLFGFSQGCLMTIEFGARFRAKLAGYIGISGYIYDAEAVLREANPAVLNADWLVTHGTRDETLPVETTRAQIETLKKGGFEVDYLEYKKVHTIDEAFELPMIHEWILKRI
jgi:phospholipase/carboxylesterase